MDKKLTLINSTWGAHLILLDGNGNALPTMSITVVSKCGEDAVLHIEIPMCEVIMQDKEEK